MTVAGENCIKMEIAMDKAVFIYTRVSTREQADEGYSLGEQEERLKKYSEAMGWKVTGIYTDPGYSGSNMERPALQQMLSDISKKHPDIVLVDKLDRLSRSQYDTLYLIKKMFAPAGASFVSRAEAFDTSTAFGRAMLGILSTFAELERERIKERMMEGKEGRAKDGLYMGGQKPLGYYYNHDTGLTIDEKEAEIVRFIFDQAAQRRPFACIAEDCANMYDVDFFWHISSISRLLTSRLYIGDICFGGKWKKGKHEPIISPEKFDEVQTVMKEREENFSKFTGKKTKELLSGLLYCEYCKKRFHKMRVRKYFYYVCYSKSKVKGSMIVNSSCNAKRLSGKKTDALVLDQIKRIRTDVAFYDSIKQAEDGADQTLVNLEKKIALINTRINRMINLYSLEQIDMEQVKAQIDPLTAQKKELQKKIDAAESKKDNYVKREDAVTLSQAVEAAYNSGDINEARALISQLIKYISVNADSISIHWRF